MNDDEVRVPTDHPPGTLQKLRVMARRALARAPLFHPGDNVDMALVVRVWMLEVLAIGGKNGGPRGGYHKRNPLPEVSDKVNGEMRVHRAHVRRGDQR